MQQPCLAQTAMQAHSINLAAQLPRPLSGFSHSRGEKLGEGLGSLLRHRPEMVDTVSTNPTISCL